MKIDYECPSEVKIDYNTNEGPYSLIVETECIRVWWHENGQIYTLENWKDGKQDGLFLDWYENGQKSMEENWKDGKQDGRGLGWHENGQKSREANWKDGKQVGRALRWRENGQM